MSTISINFRGVLKRTKALIVRIRKEDGIRHGKILELAMDALIEKRTDANNKKGE